MQNDKNISERIAKLEATVQQQGEDLNSLRMAKHTHASWITTALNKIGVLEIQVSAHDKVVWAALFGVVGLLVTIAGFLIAKYVLP